MCASTRAKDSIPHRPIGRQHIAVVKRRIEPILKTTAHLPGLTYYYCDYKLELCSRKFIQSKHDFMTQRQKLVFLI